MPKIAECKTDIVYTGQYAQELQQFSKKGSWTKEKSESFVALVDGLTKAGYRQFSSSTRTIGLQRKGESAIYKVPDGQRGALSKLSGKYTHIICIDRTDSYSGRLFAFNEVLSTKNVTNPLGLLYLCGLSEHLPVSLHSQIEEALKGDLAYRALGSPMECDINFVITLFKGTFMAEQHFFSGKMYSPAPARVLLRHIRENTSPVIYNDLAVWARRRFNEQGGYHRYMANAEPIQSTSAGVCAACELAHRLQTANLPLEKVKDLSIEDIRRLLKNANSCPMCGSPTKILKGTRWGIARMCRRYPECSHIEAVSQN